ncbi:MAG: hypothetical protein U0768_15960 [Anaerolineae bacterium]
MFPRRFIGMAIGALLLFGLLFVVAPNMQRDAWMQGYLMGQLAGGKDAGAAALLAPYMMHSGGPGFGGGFGFLLLIPLGFLFFVGVGKFMRYRAWQHGYGHGGPGGWHRHGPPPWAQGQGAPQGQAQPQTPDQPQGPPEGGQPQTPPWGQGGPPWAQWQQPPWGQWQQPPQTPPPPSSGSSDRPTE